MLRTVPSFENVLALVGGLCIDAQMEGECIIVALIYLHRLLKESRGQFVLLAENWEDVFLSCCILSNKVWDDFHMSNADYCVFAKDSTLERLNKLELGLLNLISYRCHVSASTYSCHEGRIQSWCSPQNFEDSKRNDLNADAEILSDTSVSHLPVVTDECFPVDSFSRSCRRKLLPPLQPIHKKHADKKSIVSRNIHGAHSPQFRFSPVVLPALST